MNPALVIDENIARKVLGTIDAGLSNGMGQPVPGEMCVEAAVCYALGLPHGDDPHCVAQSLRYLKIKLNDQPWSSKAARARGLRRLGLVQLGSAGVLDEKEFVKRVAEYTIRTQVPAALRSAASVHKDAVHKAALLQCALTCENNPTRDSALEAKAAAYAAYAAANAAAYAAANAAAYAADAAADAANAAAYAAANAAADAANAAAYAANAAADAANAAAYAANAAAYAANAAADAANATAYAADAAAYAAAESRARDKQLSEFAEGVVRILIEMKAPGAQWLGLTESN